MTRDVAKRPLTTQAGIQRDDVDLDQRRTRAIQGLNSLQIFGGF